MVNFRQPYLADSLQDFWRRWHISLSTWLRDYLYIPLGGNRHGKATTYRNLMLTMLLGGLWHGANWTFVVWGAHSRRRPRSGEAYHGRRGHHRASQQHRAMGAAFRRVQCGMPRVDFFSRASIHEAFTALGGLLHWSWQPV